MRRAAFVILSILLFILGCISLSAQTTVSPTSISATLNAGTTSTQTLKITNSGAAVSYSTGVGTTSGGFWLVRTPKSGTLVANGDTLVTITLDARSAPPGTHKGTLTITPSGKATITVPVTLVVKGLSFTVAPASTNFKMTDSELRTQSVSVSSADSFTVGATSSVPWVTLDKVTSPVTPTAPATFIATIKPKGVNPGIHTVTISFDAVDSLIPAPTQKSVLTVSVFSSETFEVSPSPALFTAGAGAATASPSQMTVQVKNVGGATTYYLSSGQSWLKVSKSTGSMAENGVDTFGLSASATGMKAGTYTGSVSLSAINRAAVLLQVTLSVGATANLGVTPVNVSFNGTAGQAASLPASAQVTVTNTGDAVDYLVAPSAPWLKVNKTSGQLPLNGSDTFSVSASPQSLVSGTHTGSIQVSAAGRPTRTIDVTFYVGASDSWSAAPETLSFDATAGSLTSLAAQAVTVSNQGSATSYTVSKNAAWLVVSKAGGSLALNGTDSFTITANPTGLTAGSYAGLVTLAASGRPNRTVSVSLKVATPNDLTLAPGSLTFDATAGGATAPTGQTISLTNQGPAVSYTVSKSAAWITLSKTAGTLAQDGTDSLTVGVTPTSMLAGTYNGTVTVTADGRPTRTVAVALVVAAGTDLTLSATKLSYSGVAGQSFSGPAASTVRLTNKGPAVSYTLTASAPWLVLNKTSGSLGANLSDTFTVAANPANLAAGVYAGTVTASAADRPSRLLTVSLTVAAGEDMKLSITAAKFTGVAGEWMSTPSSTGVRIFNTGGEVGYTASSSVAWLVVSNPTGILPQNSSAVVSFSANSTSLAEGTYTGLISFRAANRPQRDLTVTLVVTKATGTEGLSLTPPAINTSMGLKTASSKIAVTVSNTGGQAAYQLTRSSTWMVLSKTTGVMPANGSDIFYLSFSLTGLKAGLYQGTVNVQAPARPEQVLSVQLEVLEAAPAVSSLIAFPPAIEFVSGAGKRDAVQSLRIFTEDGSAVRVRIEAQDAGLLTLNGELEVTMPGQVEVAASDSGSLAKRESRLLAIPADPAIEPVEIPVLVRPAEEQVLSIPWLADGAGTSTRITLVNRGQGAARVHLDLHEALAGAETRSWPLLLEGYDPALGVLIPEGESVTLESSGLLSEVAAGWARVRADRPVDGFAVIRQDSERKDSPAVRIPLNKDYRQRVALPFDAGASDWERVALSNLSEAEPAEATILLLDSEGTPTGKPQVVTVPALGHQSIQVADLLDGKDLVKGTIEMSFRGGRMSSVGIASREGRIVVRDVHANLDRKSTER
jgi:hypothetical protein